MKVDINYDKKGNFKFECTSSLEELFSDKLETAFNKIEEITTFKYKDLESFVKSIDEKIDITKRTVGYYIEQELLPTLKMIEGKKFGYYTPEHLYKYIYIALLRDTISLKMIKITLNIIDKNNLSTRDCITAYLSLYNINYKLIKENMDNIREKFQEDNDIIYLQKIIALSGSIDASTELLNEEINKYSNNG